MAQQKTVYDFELKKANGEPLVLSQFKGKKLLIVNTASKGKSVAKHEGRVIFVKGGVPGDICNITVFKKRKSRKCFWIDWFCYYGNV